MKTKLTLIAALALTLTGKLQAQTYEAFPNGGFENWDTIDGYSNPRGWYSLNELTQFGLDATTLLTTDAHSGHYAVKLVSKSSSSSSLPGVICAGKLLDSATFEPNFDHAKIPYTRRPTTLKFYYKSNVVQGDAVGMLFVLTRWNVAQQKTDTVGMAQFQSDSNYSTYQQTVVNFVYSSPLPPDSALVIAASSLDGFDPVDGTEFYLDDIQIGFGPTGIDEAAAVKVSVYPNPATDVLHINASEKISEASLFDLAGRQHAAPFNGKDLSLAGVEKGLYILQVKTAKGMAVSKVLVQ